MRDQVDSLKFQESDMHSVRDPSRPLDGIGGAEVDGIVSQVRSITKMLEGHRQEPRSCSRTGGGHGNPEVTSPSWQVMSPPSTHTFAPIAKEGLPARNPVPAIRRRGACIAHTASTDSGNWQRIEADP